MSILGMFSNPTLGMMAQSKSLQTIGTNIANVNTGGYKRMEQRFDTVLSESITNQGDLGGVKTKPYYFMREQGVVVASQSELDLAITGRGFFQLNTTLDGSGDELYTRDGAFQLVPGEQASATDQDGNPISVTTQYLADKNGYFVLGWEPDDNGVFPDSGTAGPMRLDTYAFTNTGKETAEAALQLNLDASAGTNRSYTYAIHVFDDLGQKQSIPITFTKSEVNRWDVSMAVPQVAEAQVDTLTLGGTVEANDTFKVTINGNTVTYTVTGAEADMNAVRNALVAAINADANVSSTVIAAAGTGTGALTITARDAGTAFTDAVNTTQGTVAVAQVNTATIAGTIEAGDIYSATVNATTVSYTVTAADVLGGATINDIRNNLVAAINANATLSAVVTAAPGGAGQFTVTADAAGTPFTLAMAFTDGGGTADNAAASVNTTANVTAYNDNTLTLVNTNANVPESITSTLTDMVFDSNGQIVSPTSYTLALDFNGSTADVVLDVSEMVQYAGAFTAFSYTQDGYARSDLVKWSFNADGVVQGEFSDSTHRPLYKVPLAIFTNENSLELRNGNTFAESPDSGEAVLHAAGGGGYGTFLPNAHELSNVDLASEMTLMIMTQNAYNSSATVFRTVDEMTRTAADLKG